MLHVSAVHPSKLLSRLFHCIITTFCLFIHLLMDIWIVSSSRLLWIKLLVMFMYESVWTYVYIYLGWIPESRWLRDTMVGHLNFIRNNQTVFTMHVPFYVTTSIIGECSCSSFSSALNDISPEHFQCSVEGLVQIALSTIVWEMNVLHVL